MKISDLNTPVAERIAQIIQDRGLKQSVVAEKVGFSKQQFNAMLNGRRLIKVSDLPTLAKALNVTPNDLFGEAS